LSASPSPAEYYYPKSLDRRQQLGPCDLAIYHYTYAWSWLSDQKITGESCQVIHLHNIESDLFDLRAQKETQPGISWIHKLNARKLRKIESSLVQYADQFWFVSQADREDYCLRYPMPPEKTKIRVPSYDSRMYELRVLNFRHWIAASSRDGIQPVRLGFVGTLDFDPNIMSLNWILDEICPKLQSSGWPGEISVVGRNASPTQIQKMARYPFVKYLGFVKDMESFWQELSCFLVPHIEGSGVRVKLLDALASGVPVLANTAALDRIDSALMDGNRMTVADTPEAWLKHILSLKDHELRQSQLQKKMPEAMAGESVYGDLR
jgi:glycosyltransferase involved in cell wall biosynthesis